MLDLRAPEVLKPQDKDTVDYLLFGGILGDHPPRDRTSYLRPVADIFRHLGPEQMSTDGAVNVSWAIFKGAPYETLKFCPFPLEFQVSATEKTELPFKYLQDENGEPCLPPGLRELVVSDFTLDGDLCISADDLM